MAPKAPAPEVPDLLTSAAMDEDDKSSAHSEELRAEGATEQQPIAPPDESMDPPSSSKRQRDFEEGDESENEADGLKIQAAVTLHLATPQLQITVERLLIEARRNINSAQSLKRFVVSIGLALGDYPVDFYETIDFDGLSLGNHLKAHPEEIDEVGKTILALSKRFSISDYELSEAQNQFKLDVLMSPQSESETEEWMRTLLGNFPGLFNEDNVHATAKYFKDRIDTALNYCTRSDPLTYTSIAGTNTQEGDFIELSLTHISNIGLLIPLPVFKTIGETLGKKFDEDLGNYRDALHSSCIFKDEQFAYLVLDDVVFSMMDPIYPIALKGFAKTGSTMHTVVRNNFGLQITFTDIMQYTLYQLLAGILEIRCKEQSYPYTASLVASGRKRLRMSATVPMSDRRFHGVVTPAFIAQNRASRILTCVINTILGALDPARHDSVVLRFPSILSPGLSGMRLKTMAILSAASNADLVKVSASNRMLNVTGGLELYCVTLTQILRLACRNGWGLHQSRGQIAVVSPGTIAVEVMGRDYLLESLRTRSGYEASMSLYSQINIVGIEALVPRNPGEEPIGHYLRICDYITMCDSATRVSAIGSIRRVAILKRFILGRCPFAIKTRSPFDIGIPAMYPNMTSVRPDMSLNNLRTRFIVSAPVVDNLSGTGSVPTGVLLHCVPVVRKSITISDFAQLLIETQNSLVTNIEFTVSVSLLSRFEAAMKGFEQSDGVAQVTCKRKNMASKRYINEGKGYVDIIARTFDDLFTIAGTEDGHPMRVEATDNDLRDFETEMGDPLTLFANGLVVEAAIKYKATRVKSKKQKKVSFPGQMTLATMPAFSLDDLF